jgi:hypothetical protein
MAENEKGSGAVPGGSEAPPILAHIGVAVLAALLLAGCAKEPQTMAYDQCLRAQLFRECLERLPRGPTHTAVSNDWDEVVSECESAASYQCQRRVEFIKPECRGW